MWNGRDSKEQMATAVRICESCRQAESDYVRFRSIRARICRACAEEQAGGNHDLPGDNWLRVDEYPQYFHDTWLKKAQYKEQKAAEVFDTDPIQAKVLLDIAADWRTLAGELVTQGRAVPCEIAVDVLHQHLKSLPPYRLPKIFLTKPIPRTSPELLRAA